MQPNGERDREAFAAAGQACAALSWRYAVWDRLDGVFVANQRWLAGYRHPRCFDEAIAARLLEVFNRPRALMDGAELVGDPLGALPVLYHLLWKQLLVADLAVVLSPRTMVRTAHRHTVVAFSGATIRLLSDSGESTLVGLGYLLSAEDFELIGPAAS